PFTRPLFCRSRALAARVFAPGPALQQNQTAPPNQASFPQPRPHHTPAYAAGAPPSARLGRTISTISITAPTVIALSAILNAGKYQLCCQCTRMKSATWPCTRRSYRLPRAPPRNKARDRKSVVEGQSVQPGGGADIRYNADT